MNQLRIKKDLYEIEVNDKGEKITFDLKDLSIPKRLNEAIERIDNETKIYNGRLNEILKKYNLKQEDIKNISISKGVGKEVYDLQMDFFGIARDILDSVLGENACQKIFGDSNYIEMFQDLFEALKPHFKKMKFDIKSKQKALLEKYNSNNKNARVIR